MPYTPPSRSAASTSPPDSPDAERSHSEATVRNKSPRSSSYLTRHRRTPTALGLLVRQGNGRAGSNDITPPGTSDDLMSMATSKNIRQSPPPMTGLGGMPSGAVISPPDSLSGSDDEGLEMRGRKLTNLRELQVAVSHISMHRGSSPNSSGLTIELPEAVGSTEGMHHSFSTGALDALGSQMNVLYGSNKGLNVGAGGSPLTASEEDSDVEKQAKPPMLRKKSGELVRPALRGTSCRRPSSMPGTPTFAKAVHFDAHLEHVRHFLQVDRPLAVSAGTSPIENHLESDSEYPFPSSEDETSKSRSLPYEWELNASSFSENVARNSIPARVERFWLSKDSKSLQGSISVANLAFHKQIACRFTLDNWKTTSEVAAEYTGQVHGSSRERWTFTIRLSDMANLELKTMYLCVRYHVNGQEYWDNNGGTNFNVGFHKKYLAQNGKRGYAGAGARAVGELPRSTRRAQADAPPRSKSTTGGLSSDGFSGPRRAFDKGHEYRDENGPIRLKRHTANSRSEDFTSSTAPRNQAFGRRYDFNASLHEAKQSARTRDNRKATDVNANKAVKYKPPVISSSGNDSPSRKNYTYDEIVNRFCFYGSKQSSTQQGKEETLGLAKIDGSDDTVRSIGDTGGHRRQPSSQGSSASPPRPHLEHSQGTATSDAVPRERPLSPPMRSTSPATNFSPRVSTPPASLATHHAQRHNRFPFSPEAHAPTAIHG